MSQTDSLKDQMLEDLAGKIQIMALRLSLTAEELERALLQLEVATPVSLRISLQLLEVLVLETVTWKFVPQTCLLLFSLQKALETEQTYPDLILLYEMLQQHYPEYFGQEFWHA